MQLLGGAATAMLATTALAAGGGSGGHAHATDGKIGAPGVASEATRSVEVLMTDNAYSIEKLHVKEGETVRFVIRNDGDFVHEFNIGTAHMHEEHQVEMAHMMETGMIEADRIGSGHDHHDANSLLLAPGATGELVWTFGEAMDLEFACNLPGHYQSGMVGPLHVEHGH